ncbi:M57 family metalloprotease [uncultured Hymenobacter sp.]|uniref:M57 family metalloprotease n=1 Tax=uncultured Hymenobacter sp. TaxID=170016 RepID=UPI0035CAADB0
MMKFTKSAVLALCGAASLSLAGCQKQEEAAAKPELSAETISQIKALGFGTADAKAVEGGVLVEGDILLTPEVLASKADYNMLRVGDDEQYRTTNVVSVGSGRTINVAISTSLPSTYVAAVDEAIRRFNAEGLLLRYRRVSSGYNTLLTAAPSGSTYLASAGFPSGGNPFSSVKVNVGAIGSNPNTNYLATILAHELGHTIGFRHTDYADRSYSCGGAYTNEGASDVGAILIPGTPSGPDPNSWMLACIGTGANRYFNTNDRTALRYIY